ncbi:MAG: hypothetical protein HUJ72_12780 [Blautia sp.]|nr:hypothetical protein [Blautia sp.]
MKLTERDKKLLVLLIVFLFVVGLGMLLVRPILEKNAQIKQQITDQESLKRKKEEKIAELPAREEQLRKLNDSLAEYQDHYYDIIGSSDIDKILTEMALKYKLQITDLEIQMPFTDTFSQLSPYQGADILVSSTGASGSEKSYPGLYTVSISMRLEGNRNNLQMMLDECAGMEPKLRVTAFSWFGSTMKVNFGPQENEEEIDPNIFSDETDTEEFLSQEQEETTAEEVAEITEIFAEEETEGTTRTAAANIEGHFQLHMNLELYMYQPKNQYLLMIRSTGESQSTAADYEEELADEYMID